MEYKTYADLKLRAQERVDTEDETFVDDNELLRYCQEAVDMCEARIHDMGIGDKYFETVTPLLLKSGYSDYQFPSNIYANKILRIIWNRANDVYEIKRLTREKRYTDSVIIDRYSTPDLLTYRIYNNDPSVKPVIRMTPRPNYTVPQVTRVVETTISSNLLVVTTDVTGISVGDFVSGDGIPMNSIVEEIDGLDVYISANCTATDTDASITFTKPDVLMFYVRNANKPVDDDSIIDIPEFYNFIVQYMIVESLKKDVGNPRIEQETAKLDMLSDQMVTTLAGMVEDQDDHVEIVSNFEEEMS
jgi:hypothetical protein